MTSKALQMSINGRETNGDLARRNLASYVAGLRTMRYMVTNALEADDPLLQDFDDGFAKLERALARLNAQLGS
jgi:hypothetical protein